MKGFWWTARIYTSDIVINLLKMFPLVTAANNGKMDKYTKQVLIPPFASPLTALLTASSLSDVGFPWISVQLLPFPFPFPIPTPCTPHPAQICPCHLGGALTCGISAALSPCPSLVPGCCFPTDALKNQDPKRRKENQTHSIPRQAPAWWGLAGELLLVQHISEQMPPQTRAIPHSRAFP